MLTAAATASDLVGLIAIKTTLSSVLGYLPKLLSALLIFALGGWLASVARRAVAAVLSEVRSTYAHAIESATELVILVLVSTVGIAALGVRMTFIHSNLILIVGTVIVTIGFLFTWSMRRPAEQIIANYYLRRLVQVGDAITLGQQTGKLTKFVALGVLIRADSGVEHFVPARCILDGLHRSSKATPNLEQQDDI